MDDALRDLLDLTEKDGSNIELVERELRSIPVGDISPNSYQPRRNFDEDELSSLAASITEVGVLQPILVRPNSDSTYELIAGERRWRAATRAGLAEIPAVVGEYRDLDSFEQAIVENLHRSDLNPLEEARAYKKLSDEFGMTHVEIAKRMGKSRPSIVNAIRLLNLPAEVLALLEAGDLSAGHARTVLAIDDPLEQLHLANLAIRKGLSVRALENEVRRLLRAEVAGNSATGQAKPNFGHLEVEERISEHLQTKVKVEGGASKGRITIEFADTVDLARIFELIVPRQAP